MSNRLNDKVALVTGGNSGIGKEAKLKQLTEGVVPKIPLGRFEAAKDIADCAVSLASNESNYVFGAEFVVDGGFSQL